MLLVYLLWIRKQHGVVVTDADFECGATQVQVPLINRWNALCLETCKLIYLIASDTDLNCESTCWKAIFRELFINYKIRQHLTKVVSSNYL